jgi:hypothetical protein
MKVMLTLSGNFHTPVSFWLDLTLQELFDWASTAQAMLKEAGGGKK